MTQQHNNFSAEQLNSQGKTPSEVDQKYSGSAKAAAAESPIPKVLQIRTPADVLAYVQSTLGFRPTNSLVIVAFDRSQLSTVVRCDLPGPLQQTLQRDDAVDGDFLMDGLTDADELQCIKIGKHLGHLLSREQSITRCLLLYLPAKVRLPDLYLLTAVGTIHGFLSAQLRLQSVRVDESWLIHNAQLWHVQCAAVLECTVQAVPVADPEATRVFRALDPTNASANQNAVPAKSLRFPPPTNIHGPAVADLDSVMNRRPENVLRWLSKWDERIGAEPSMMHSDDVAELLRAMEYPALRNAVMAVAAFDLTTTLRGMAAEGVMSPEARIAAGIQQNFLDASSIKSCVSGSSDRAPNWKRIAALERLCHQLIPLADNLSGAAVAGALVWIEWVRGRGTLAMNYVQQAIKRYPRDSFLVVLERRLSNGDVAQWATRTDSAWNHQHAA